VCGCWCIHTGAAVHVYTAFPGFWGGDDLFFHMQWVKLHCDTTLGTLIHIFYNTPRGVCLLVYPHCYNSSCLHCLSRVLRWCWHMQWVKLHCDTTLGTVIHIFYHTPRGVSMLMYPHWCNNSCLHFLSGVLRGGVELLFTHAMGEAPLWYYPRYFDP
jgi:hypothetical protein